MGGLHCNGSWEVVKMRWMELSQDHIQWQTGSSIAEPSGFVTSMFVSK